MQDLRIDELLNNVTMNAANVCGDLTTIRISFNELKKEIKELETRNENLLKELNETEGTLDEKVVNDLKKENDDLKVQNERLKTEVTEALAKRDYYQDLANKEAADAKKAKQDCEKEMKWQRNKLRELDYVLTEYRSKIKELEFGLDEKSRLAILAGACAIRGHEHYYDGKYCNIVANGMISWKHAEQVLMSMITKE